MALRAGLAAARAALARAGGPAGPGRSWGRTASVATTTGLRPAPLAARLAAGRGLMAASRAWADVQVAVPAMGDSITEGSVAAIVKGEREGRNRLPGWTAAPVLTQFR